ncbi:MAG: hypothetical protein NTV51_25540 [Verrucomicrobia bacterium]|nr:hypothetical protein [Verrucomicrobiota bacterium]
MKIAPSWLAFALFTTAAFAAETTPAAAPAEPFVAITTPGWRYEEQRRMPAPEAGQGVVSDGEFLYAINNHTIAKYRPATGERVALWEGGANGAIIHLNAGIVHEGKLYCAHSNYPGVPMLSSVEIFDLATLKHVGTHSLGRADGSFTWLDRRKGKWVACFVHYGKKGGEPGKGPEWTQLVEFDDDWRRTGGWALPADLLARIGNRGYSASGGAFGPGGLLYLTGHDNPELYALDFPEGGSVLTWVATVAITAEGQAFGWDPRQSGVLYTIGRKSKEMITGRVTKP